MSPLTAWIMKGSSLPRRRIRKGRGAPEGNGAAVFRYGDITPAQREPVKKVYFEERTFVSIAREEGVGESAIRDRIKRIHKKLEKI